MTHTAETGAENRLHFSGAVLWHVCHANVGPDSSGKAYQIPAPIKTLHYAEPEPGVHTTEMMILSPFIVYFYHIL